jgi:hypothetical protein
MLPQHISATHCHVVEGCDQECIHCWSHHSTTGHTGQIVIHIHPQHRYCLSSFWGNTTLWWWQWISETCWGKIWNVINKLYCSFDAFVGYFITINEMILEKPKQDVLRLVCQISKSNRNITADVLFHSGRIWQTYRKGAHFRDIKNKREIPT